MTTDILINSATRSELESFIESHNHAIGLVAEKGFGKTSLINWMIEKYLFEIKFSIDSYPYLKVIKDNEGSIAIDTIREIRSFLKLKIPGDSRQRRFVVIDHADNMTAQAQNALLKTLEDPPADTVIFLSLNNEESVLPTIRSRIQLIHLKRLSRTDLIDYFIGLGHSKTDVDKAYLVSGGLAGRISDFLSNKDSDMVNVVQEAKNLLASSQFNRLIMVDSIYKDKKHCLLIVKTLIQIGQSGIEATAKRNDQRSLIRWHRVVAAAYRAEESLTRNAQPKLVLTDLMLNL